MAAQSSLFEAQSNSKMAFLAEACPTCDQPIPRDRYEEIKEKIQARERKRSDEIAARLHEQYSREKLLALEEAGRISEARIAEACDATRRNVEAAGAKQFAEIESANAYSERREYTGGLQWLWSPSEEGSPHHLKRQRLAKALPTKH